jgi:hypothetical protein
MVLVAAVTAAAGRAQAQPRAETETEFEPEPDNKAIEPPQPGAPPSRERPKKRQPQPAAPAPAYERSGRGGFAIELSAGGLSSGSIQAGIVLGIGFNGFLFGLMLDTMQSAAIPASTPGFETEAGSIRVGVAARMPLLRTADGRVSLFAGGDFAMTKRDTIIANTAYHADGVTWSVGPGLRFWLNDHLSLAYLTRLRWTRLDGAGGALPDVGADPPDTQLSAKYTQYEGVFQFLCVF